MVRVSKRSQGQKCVRRVKRVRGSGGSEGQNRLEGQKIKVSDNQNVKWLEGSEGHNVNGSDGERLRRARKVPGE